MVEIILIDHDTAIFSQTRSPSTMSSRARNFDLYVHPGSNFEECYILQRGIQIIDLETQEKVEIVDSGELLNDQNKNKNWVSW